MTLDFYLWFTPIVVLLYNYIGYFWLEGRHDAAIIKNDKLAEKMDFTAARHNSKIWHIFDAYFVVLTYLFMISHQVLLYGALGGEDFFWFTGLVLVLHGSVRWLSHDTGVYKWWLGYWRSIVPSTDGPWDLSNRFDQWIAYKVGFNHWYLKFIIVAGYYFVYYLRFLD